MNRMGLIAMFWRLFKQLPTSKDQPELKFFLRLFSSAKCSLMRLNIQISFLQNRAIESLSLSDLAQFLELFSQLLKGSIPAIEALESIACSASERFLRRAAREAKEHLLLGGHFCEFFEQSKKTGQRAVYILTRTGQENGFLALSLERSTQLLRSQIAWSEQLRSQLAYPALLLSSATIILGLYALLIAPLYAELLIDSKAPPALLRATAFPWMWCCIVCATTALAIWSLVPKVRQFARAVRACLAFWRPTKRARALSLVFELLAQLLKDQRAFDKSWALIPFFTSNVELSKELALSVGRMLAGQMPSEALRDLRGLGELELQFVRIGERTGQMDRAAQSLATHLNRHCQQKLKKFLALLQPLLLAFLGLIIARIALLIARPLQEVNVNDLF